jgi:hypothetical protein
MAVKPEKPSNYTDKQIRVWWDQYVSGMAVGVISDEHGCDLSTVERGLAYWACKLGAPTRLQEFLRVTETHHRSQLGIAELISASRTRVERIERAIAAIEAGRDLGELGAEEVMVWSTLSDRRDKEVAAQTKLYAEHRGVATALTDLFGLKKMAIPVGDEEEKDDAKPSRLKEMTIDEIRKLRTRVGEELGG